jgi:hypothetical protein
MFGLTTDHLFQLGVIYKSYCQVLTSELTSVNNTQLLLKLAMEQHVFCIFIDYRGHHRKGVAICYAA